MQMYFHTQSSYDNSLFRRDSAVATSKPARDGGGYREGYEWLSEKQESGNTIMKDYW